MEETSLEDFLDAETGGGDSIEAEKSDTTEAETEQAAEAERDGDTSERIADVEADESVLPTAVTSRYVPDGIGCEACGDRVVRVWSEVDGRVVCSVCKDWG